MDFLKKTLKFTTTHENKLRKGLDWAVSIGNLGLFIFRVLMNKN